MATVLFAICAACGDDAGTSAGSGGAGGSATERPLTEGVYDGERLTLANNTCGGGGDNVPAADWRVDWSSGESFTLTLVPEEDPVTTTTCILSATRATCDSFVITTPFNADTTIDGRYEPVVLTLASMTSFEMAVTITYSCNGPLCATEPALQLMPCSVDYTYAYSLE